MDINELCHNIRFSNLTNDELNMISNAIRYRRSLLADQNRYKLSIGCKVQFRNSRTGQMIIGTVNKINRKNVLVGSGFNVWRVPGNMLEKV